MSVQVGRLALRREGDWWVAYYAKPDTMEGAHRLGSILITLVDGDDAIRQGFMDLMRSVVGNLIEDVLGERPDWKGETPAPEHERSGNA